MTTDLEPLAEQIHAMLRMAPGTAADHRALHAKGVVATGSFVPSGALAGRTTAAHLLGGDTPATVRFSHPGGDPSVSDTIPSARGMAVKLRAAGGTHDLVTVTSPAFLARDGASFVELLLARAPDPATGVPDPARMGAYLETHPEALPAIEAVLTAKVAASYATLAYNSLHTFFVVDDTGVRTPVRFTWTPVAGIASLDDASDRDPDFLAHELADRLAVDPVAFDLVVHLGTDEDPTDDPTAIWPERPTVVAGRLELRAIDPAAEPIIFDPTNVPAGLALPSDDEILALRRLVYGLSYSAHVLSHVVGVGRRRGVRSAPVVTSSTSSPGARFVNADRPSAPVVARRA